MIEILPAPTHVAAFRVSGKLTPDDYERMYGEVDTKLQSHEHIGIYADAQELAGVTAKALAKDLAFAFGRLGEFRRFPRGAVVTDRSWLRRVTQLSNALLRSIELRTFGSAERVAAMSWVAELHDEPRAPALRMVPTTRPDVIAFAINGTVAVNEASEFVSAAEAVLDRNERVRLLGRFDSPFGISPSAFKQSGMAAFKWRIRHKIDRYAIVGGPRWVASWVGLLRNLARIDIRHFDERDESAAWSWIGAQPA
jgi:hypothetical protein